MKRLVTFLMGALCVLGLSACATVGPNRVAEQYRNAVETGDVATQRALYTGVPYTQRDADRNLAILHDGQGVTVLVSTNHQWRVACSSFGVPAQSDPVRHALLSALSAIEAQRWQDLEPIIPQAVARPFKPDAAMKAYLSELAPLIWPYACEPFVQRGDAWELPYGDSPRTAVRIKQEQQGIIIEEWD